MHDYTLSERDVLKKLLGSTVNKENVLSRSRAGSKRKYLLARNIGRDPRCLGIECKVQSGTFRSWSAADGGNSKAIISLDLACFMSTYMASLACLLYYRFREQGLVDKSLWSLGRRGPVINVGAFCYTAFAFFWSFWPDLKPVTLQRVHRQSIMFIMLITSCHVQHSDMI